LSCENRKQGIHNETSTDNPQQQQKRNQTNLERAAFITPTDRSGDRAVVRELPDSETPTQTKLFANQLTHVQLATVVEPGYMNGRFTTISRDGYIGEKVSRLTGSGVSQVAVVSPDDATGARLLLLWLGLVEELCAILEDILDRLQEMCVSDRKPKAQDLQVGSSRDSVRN
jgi:hypothetical protein